MHKKLGKDTPFLHLDVDDWLIVPVVGGRQKNAGHFAVKLFSEYSHVAEEMQV